MGVSVLLLWTVLGRKQHRTGSLRRLRYHSTTGESFTPETHVFCFVMLSLQHVVVPDVKKSKFGRGIIFGSVFRLFREVFRPRDLFFQKVREILD